MTSKPVSPVVYRDRAFLDKHPDLGRLPGFANCERHHAVYRLNPSDGFAALVPQQRLHALTCAWSCSGCWRRRAGARGCSLVIRGLKILQRCRILIRLGFGYHLP